MDTKKVKKNKNDVLSVFLPLKGSIWQIWAISARLYSLSFQKNEKKYDCPMMRIQHNYTKFTQKKKTSFNLFLKRKTN